MKTFLFDIDGTLLDTREFILQATEHTLKEHGYETPERSVISSYVGLPFQEFYFLLTGEKDNQHLQEFHRSFQFKNLALTNPYPNTLRVLTQLKKDKYKIGAVSSRSNTKSLTLSLEHAGLLNFFDVIVSAEDTENIKPHPDPILYALKHLNSESSSTVMIGDSYVDVASGKNAGTKTVRVLTGFHMNNLNNPKPDFIIDDIGDLLNLPW